MNCKLKQLNPEIVTAAIGLLKPAFSELNNECLIRALLGYSTGETTRKAEKLLSIKEYGSLISSSKSTALCHIREGLIKVINIGAFMRIQVFGLSEVKQNGGVENE